MNFVNIIKQLSSILSTIYIIHLYDTAFRL